MQQRIDYFKQIITTYQKQEKEVAENMMASDTGLYLATQVRILTITIQNGEIYFTQLKATLILYFYN